MIDTWKMYKQVKREYFDKLEDAYSKGRMTSEEYERGKEKWEIRVLREMDRKLAEIENGDRMGN